MSVVIVRQDGKIENWRQELQELAPEIKFYNYLKDHPKDEIEVAMVWKHPPGLFSQYPSLKYLASFGAGVDFLMEDESIDPKIPITRVVDPVLASDMSEFVIGTIFSYLKNLHVYRSDQIMGIWNPIPYRRIGEVSIGIMGLGALGKRLANDLKTLGFHTLGWSNSPKSIEGISCFTGEAERRPFFVPITNPGLSSTFNP